MLEVKVRDGDCIWEICGEGIGSMTAARRLDDRGGVFMRICLHCLPFRHQGLDSGLYHAVLEYDSFFEKLDCETRDLLCTMPVSTRNEPFAPTVYNADRILPDWITTPERLTTLDRGRWDTLASAKCRSTTKQHEVRFSEYKGSRRERLETDCM